MKKQSFFSVLFMFFLLIGLAAVGLTVLSVQLGLNDGFSEYLNKNMQESVERIDSEFTGLLKELQAESSELAQSDETRLFLSCADGRAESDLMRMIYQIENDYENSVNVYVVSTTVSLGLSNAKLPRKYMYPYNTIDWGVLRKIRTGNLNPSVVLDSQNDAILILGSAVYEDEQIIGYVLIEVERKMLEERLAVIHASQIQKLVIADQYGVVLYSSDGSSDEGLGGLAASGMDASDYAELNVMRQINAYSGLYLYFQESRELLNIVRSQLGNAISVTLVFVLLSVIITAWALSDRLKRSFVELGDVVGKIEGGDFTIRAPESGFAEIASLGRSINHMANKLDLMLHNIEEKQRMLRVAQINALQLQVNPHFLYNTLDLIRWLARENKIDEASLTIVSLAKLLRRTLDLKSDIVTVGTEMELVNDYVSIQCMRYEDRLSCSMDVPEQMLALKMPKLLLLPIIENSIIHGLQDKPEAGHVNLWARQEGDYLVFHVDDDGIGMSPETLVKVSEMRQDGMYGIGLANVNKRAILFGDEKCGLKIDSTMNEGTRIVLVVKRISENREERCEDV